MNAVVVINSTISQNILQMRLAILYYMQFSLHISAFYVNSSSCCYLPERAHSAAVIDREQIIITLLSAPIAPAGRQRVLQISLKLHSEMCFGFPFLKSSSFVYERNYD